ncbi:MAG TPA: YncE family protein, partial [Gemmatimonadales bacterium]|nr:YncE family protein [Gemmatimonadales bacterium]
WTGDMTPVARTIGWLAVLGAGLAACGSSSGPSTPGQPTRLAFTRDTFAVNELGSFQLRAVAYDANGAAVPGQAISYGVTGTAATATMAGMVTGVAPGVGTLEAHLGQLGATAALEVFGHPVGTVLDSVALGSRPFGVAVSRTGVVYVTQLDNARVSRVDTNHTVVDSIEVGQVPTGITFSPDGQFAYVTNQLSQNVGVIDVALAQQARTIPVPCNPFVPFVSPDGQKLFVTCNTSMVYVADPTPGVLTDSITLTQAPNAIALNPDQQRIYVSAFFGGTVSEISIASGAVLRTFSPGGMPQGMVVSPDGAELFVANEAGWVDVYDLGTGQPEPQVVLSGGGFGLALSPDLAYLYVTEPNAGLVEIIDLGSRAVAHTLQVHGVPRRIAFTRHGGVAVIPNEGGYVSFVR